jgi:hypothetical protein
MNIKYIAIIESKSGSDAKIFSKVDDAKDFIYEYIRDDGQMIDKIMLCTFDCTDINNRESVFVDIKKLYYPKKMSKTEFKQLTLF